MIIKEKKVEDLEQWCEGTGLPKMHVNQEVERKMNKDKIKRLAVSRRFV